MTYMIYPLYCKWLLVRKLGYSGVIGYFTSTTIKKVLSGEVHGCHENKRYIYGFPGVTCVKERTNGENSSALLRLAFILLCPSAFLAFSMDRK